MFSYLIDKINEQDFKLEPFKHIYIENFFNDSDFKKIISSNEINLSRSENDNDLFDRLFDFSMNLFIVMSNEVFKYSGSFSVSLPLLENEYLPLLFCQLLFHLFQFQF